VDGINILTDGSSGVYLDGAEEVIDMYERGGMDREALYEAIMNLDVVFKSVESSGDRKSPPNG
jgi:hypothetical protein